MASTARALLLLIAVLVAARPLHAEMEKPTLHIVTGNGWTLAIAGDGAARLLRTQSPQLQSSAGAGTFDYQTLAEALKAASQNGTATSPGGGYTFGDTTPAGLSPLPQIPEVPATLAQAQRVFLASVLPLMRQLLNQYPLITEGSR